jgi:hypothetical protein
MERHGGKILMGKLMTLVVVVEGGEPVCAILSTNPTWIDPGLQGERGW